VLIRFDRLEEPVHLDGVWRYPGETADLDDAVGRSYVARGFASAVSREASVAPREKPSHPPTSPRLFFNGRAVANFPREKGVAVSVIIPLFRSERFIRPLLDSLQNSDRTPFETVFVSDGDERPNVPGKAVVLPERRGFAAAVNEGARHTEGRAICLLNADIEVRPNWLAPMLALLDKNDDVAAVGNRNLNRVGRIDSVGSEYSYSTGNFEHVLRDAEDLASFERDTLANRDMITAACLLVRRRDWQALGGIDETYRIGYFEDSDFCMRLRARGRRVVYCPDSVVVHYKNHSGAGRHAHYGANRRRFQSRWVETGLVDKFAKERGRRVHDGDVMACYIVLNEEEFIQPSIESIYPLADRIIVVEGGNDYAVAAGLCGADKRSADATIEKIRTVADPENKIELIQGAWRDKTEQRQAYAERLKPGDWMLLMDGDEVFYEAGLWRLSYLMHGGQDVLRPMFDLFWNDFRTVGTGVWDNYPQAKAIRWREGYHYSDHNCPSDANGNLIVHGQGHGLICERLYAHYAWVKPIEKLRRKAAYYERQPGARERIRPDYMDRVFLPWRERPLEIAEEFGTHPFGGGGAALFDRKHPEPIRRRLEAGEYQWE